MALTGRHVVVVLGFEAGTDGIDVAHVDRSHQPRRIAHVCGAGRKAPQVARDGGRRRFGVEACHLQLLRRARSAGSTAEHARLVHRGGIGRAVQRRRRRGPELVEALQRKRLDRREVPEHRVRVGSAELARVRAGDIGRQRHAAPVVGAQAHHLGGHLGAQRQPHGLGGTVGNAGQTLLVGGLVHGSAVREQRLQHAICRGADGRFRRRASGRRLGFTAKGL
jgi:hypothetical protein